MNPTSWGRLKHAIVIAAVMAAPATIAWGILGGAAPVLAQVDDEDLTGETCLSGTAMIDPDGNGPLPSFTYCVMNGRLGENEALEMDDTDGMPPMSGMATSVADANLFAGANPLNDPDLPFVSGATYVDWNDLAITDLTGPGAAPLGSVENHRILDFTANDDFTILRPQAASCLNDGSALPKEDFTQSYIANNEEFLYFGQERRTNNGNSVYYWLLTKEPPIVVSTTDCGSNTRGQLQFNLSEDDVELLVNFPDSSDPAGGAVFFRQFVGANSGYIPARDAVFAAGWGPLQVGPIHNFSLNIIGDGDDGFGDWGGIDSHGDPVATGSYTTASLAEWAVSLQDVFGGLSLCGQSLFVTGLSRASSGQVGDIDEPAALKDSIGPKLYSFGQISAQATVVGACEDPAIGDSFTYSAVAFGLDGVTPLDPNDFTCSWLCDDDGGRTVTLSDASACSGTGDVSEDGRTPVNVTCTVTVSEPATGCTADDDDVDQVLFPIRVDITPSPAALTCTVPGSPGSDNGNIGPGVTFAPTISGGDGPPYSLTWMVTGPNNSTCAANAATCNVDIPDGSFCALTEVKVSVDDGSPLCDAQDSEEEEVTKQTSINATNN